MRSIEWAARYAEDLLADDGHRWLHSKAVASKAAELADRLRLPDGDVLVAAAYLHDVGYAPAVALTGFHPLDGGRHLRQLGEDRLAVLAAQHGGSAEEAALRQLADAMAEFHREESHVARLLDYCDLTIGPNGEDMSPDERLADVQNRYGPEHVVTRGLRLAWPRLMEELSETEELLVAAGQPR
ncbi:MAG: HD domain-containing protein [Acidimicrobiales bacterium]